MKLLKNLARIATALERMVAVIEKYVEQQGLRLPPREPSAEPPEPGGLSYYDPVRAARLELAANDMMVRGEYTSFEDAYEEAIKRESRR